MTCDLCRARVSRIDELAVNVPEPILRLLKGQQIHLFARLCQSTGIVTYAQLAAAIDGTRSKHVENPLHVHFSEIRHRLRRFPMLIDNFTRIGYRLTDASRAKLIELSSTTSAASAA